MLNADAGDPKTIVNSSAVLSARVAVLNLFIVSSCSAAVYPAPIRLLANNRVERLSHKLSPASARGKDLRVIGSSQRTLEAGSREAKTPGKRPISSRLRFVSRITQTGPTSNGAPSPAGLSGIARGLRRRSG
jgi:hypothetical protein